MIDQLGSFIVPLLLRYFRCGEKQDVTVAQAEPEDIDLLLLHWAISPSVRDLCAYVREHPHEVRSALASRTVVASGSVRGRLHAAASVILQQRTGDPSMVEFDEPFRSFATGPNRVLGWTLRLATRLATRFRSILPTKATYHAQTLESLRAIEGASRLLPTTNDALLQPPTADDVRIARASRSMLYRKAAAAYDDMRGVTRRDRDIVSRLLNATLIGPSESWAKFELALALALAAAIGRATATRPTVKYLVPGVDHALVEVGRWIVQWQRAAPNYVRPESQHWEQRAEDILKEFGVGAGYDRPDIVVYNVDAMRVLAVGEAKYFENDDWKDRLRGAVSQVITYARGYEQTQDVDDIVGRSVIALWNTGDHSKPVPASTTTPYIATFADFLIGLDAWADQPHVASILSAQP